MVAATLFHGFPGAWEPHCNDRVHLLGLTHDPVLRIISSFTISLCIYLVTIWESQAIILIRISSQLHHPMYFFLSHLALADVGYSSSVTPNMLVNFLVEKNTISYLAVPSSFGSAVFFGSTEASFWAAMAYDRFTAICSSLLYSTKMSTQVCVQLLTVAYIGGFFDASSFTISFYFLLFCGPNQVNHFSAHFCSFWLNSPVLIASIPAVVPSFTAGSIIVVTAVVIVTVSYVHPHHHPEDAIHRGGTTRPSPTCTSHLTAVTLFLWDHHVYFTMPKSSYSTDQNKVVSVFYMVVIPMLNPSSTASGTNEIMWALKRKLARKYFLSEVCCFVGINIQIP